MRRSGLPSRDQVDEAVKKEFALYLEGRTRRFGEEMRRVTLEVSRRRNVGGYVPAFTELASKQLRRDILALAKLYVSEFTRFQISCDPRAARELENVAKQLAAGTNARVHENLKLIQTRTKRQLGLEGAQGHIHREVGTALNLALRRGKLMLERQEMVQRAKSPEPAQSSELRVTPSTVAIDMPHRSLQAITDDNNRRLEAKRDVQSALQAYLANVPRERELDQNTLTEIWSNYALTVYDSFAESFMGLPLRWETVFGETGVLAGGETLEAVKRALTEMRVPRPAHWPPPNLARSADESPEMLREIGDLVVGPNVSFGWLLDEPWFSDEIKARVLERARVWEKSSTEPDLLGAISDLTTSLKRIPADDPAYKSWEAFCHRNQETEAKWVLSIAHRAAQGKRIDPRGAIRFVLRLFDSTVDMQLKLVTDTDSAAGCEEELRILSRGSLDYLERLLKQLGHTDGTIAKWRSELELQLLQRFSNMKIRALQAAKQAARSDAKPRVPARDAARPGRRPDLKTSRDRIDLVDKLSRELAIVKRETQTYTTVAALKQKYPKFSLWMIIEDAQIKELVDGEAFRPKIFAENLVLTKYGLTSRETLKKDRKKLRKANQTGEP